MTPYWVSKSHCQTVSEATTGIAQASSSPACTSSRIGPAINRISSATPMPSTIVRAAFTRQKATVRNSTFQR